MTAGEDECAAVEQMSKVGIEVSATASPDTDPARQPAPSPEQMEEVLNQGVSFLSGLLGNGAWGRKIEGNPDEGNQEHTLGGTG